MSVGLPLEEPNLSTCAQLSGRKERAIEEKRGKEREKWRRKLNVKWKKGEAKKNRRKDEEDANGRVMETVLQ